MLTRTWSIAAIAAFTSPAYAGTVMESVNRDLTGTRAETVVTAYAQDGRMRVESAERGSYMLFKDDALYSISTKDKAYTVMDRATLQKMAQTINPALKQMQGMLEKMSPEQRAQMERLVGNKMPATSKPGTQEIRKTGRSGKIAGHACTYAEVLENGVLEDEYCVVASSALAGGVEFMAAAQKMSTLLQEIFKDVDAPWLKETVDRQAANYARLGGVPVQTRHFEDGKAVSETLLKSIRTEALPAATFEVPAGYTRRDLMGR